VPQARLFHGLRQCRSFDSIAVAISLRMTFQLRRRGQRLFTAQIVFVVAFVGGDGAALNFEHARGQAIDEIAVVRDEDHGAAIAEMASSSTSLARMSRWLVARRAAGSSRARPECAPERNGCARAGEHAQRLEDVVAGKEKAAEQRAQRGFRNAHRRAADVVEHARFRIEHLVLSCAKYSATTLWPSFIVPALGASSPMSILMRVDLPAPFTPTSATRSPRSMVKRASENTHLIP